MNIEIREASLEDVNNGLLEVYIEGYRHHQNGRPDIFLNLSEETLKEDLIKSFEDSTIMILLEDNIIVGYISYKIKYSHTAKINIEQLAVSEKYRHKGYARLLINNVIETAKFENCSRIELNCWMFNKNAQEMYEHIGFVPQRTIYELNVD